MLKKLNEIYAENSKKTIDEKVSSKEVFKYFVVKTLNDQISFRFSKLKLRRFWAKSVFYRENVRAIAAMVIGANWKEAIWLGE